LILSAACTKDGFIPGGENLLQAVKIQDKVVTEYFYNIDNQIEVVRSATFFQRFHYDTGKKLIRQDVAVSPMAFSSSLYPIEGEFFDPEETGISMYNIYEYGADGLLSTQLNYVPEDDINVLRSFIIFEYNSDSRISRLSLHSADGKLTQYRTYLYDEHGNVSEEEYYSCLPTQQSSDPVLITKHTYEYDNFHNPYMIFSKTAQPGLFSNHNNIIRTVTLNYYNNPADPDRSESSRTYKYNYDTGYPERIQDGEEFIYY
jgi:hypothetical protein